MRFPKTLTFLMLVMGLAFALPASTQQMPFTQEQVSNMVRDGFGDESGAKLIEQRGIDFAPTEDFLQSLKAGGANEAFLNALRAAKLPGSASPKKPLNQVQVFALLVGQVPSHRVTMLVQERGIDYVPTDDYLQEVRLAGGEDELIGALKSANVTKPATVDPAVQARQAQVQQHVAHGAELARKGQNAEAEQEYRTALLLDSQNADIYASLAFVLMRQDKGDDALAAAREAVDLNPNNDMTHTLLALALKRKGDLDGAIAEYREALRLNPDNGLAHALLANALSHKGDLDGAISEYREAVRLNPNSDAVRDEFGNALSQKGDQDGAITEFHEALRLNPNNGQAHANLGIALESKGDRQGALEEYRAAYKLDPRNTNFMQNYERLLQQVNQ